MIIKNISARQFSLEGVVLNPGEEKDLPVTQAETFLSIYAHLGVLAKVENIEPEPIVVAQETPAPEVAPEVVPEVIPETPSEPVSEAPKKVRKPRTKNQ